ncbi:MAG TPA: septum formation inhibitor Maf [Firmicutes bacterium]|nr:septum formation inhibitor Maf [Bacillota bacterium]
MNFILASASPRRADLLKQAGIPFEVVVPSVSEEVREEGSPEEKVRLVAEKKAFAVAGKLKNGFVVAADTAVLAEGRILGKPGDSREAFQMLRLLAGRRHEVLTGLVVCDTAAGRYKSGVKKTSVWLKKLTDRQIRAYVASGEPMDKAGAYGIQGRAALFIEKINGCYSNVVGLPLGLLYELTTSLDIPLWLNGRDGEHAE